MDENILLVVKEALTSSGIVKAKRFVEELCEVDVKDYIKESDKKRVSDTMLSAVQEGLIHLIDILRSIKTFEDLNVQGIFKDMSDDLEEGSLSDYCVEIALSLEEGVLKMVNALVLERSIDYDEVLGDFEEGEATFSDEEAEEALEVSAPTVDQPSLQKRISRFMAGE